MSQFTFPPAVNKISNCFTYSPKCGSVSLFFFLSHFNVNHSNGYLNVALICISLVINEVEHLLRHLLVIWLFIPLL